MTRDPVRTSGGSWILQGCLFGAVALFVLLLFIMVFLAFRRFRENTAPADEISSAAVASQPHDPGGEPYA